MSTLSNVKNITLTRNEELRDRARLGLVKVLDYLPSAVIVGLIALYYIQLSHMG